MRWQGTSGCDPGFLSIAARGQVCVWGVEFEPQFSRGLEGEFQSGQLAFGKPGLAEGFNPAEEAAGARVSGGRGGHEIEEGKDDGFRLLFGSGG